MAFVTAYGTTPSERLRAAVPAITVHALLALALLYGLSPSPPAEHSDPLKLIRLPPAPPVPKEDSPPPTANRAARDRPAEEQLEAAASPPALQALATPIVAPEPIVPLPLPTPPMRAAPVAGTGTAPTAGASTTPGPGTGAGGSGRGTRSGGGGGGGGGGGTGSGRGITPPRQIAGGLGIEDMPEALRERGFRGTVSVIYRADPDGRARACRVTRSSGSRALDQITCRLIEQRWRLRPPRDAEGRPAWGYVEEDHEFEAD